MDMQTTLALYRTRLSERRTAMSQIQLGFVLVTVPVTLHAGFMMLAERHADARPALLSLPGTVLAIAVVAAGVAFLVVGVRDLVANSAQLRGLKRRLEPEVESESDPGRRRGT